MHNNNTSYFSFQDLQTLASLHSASVHLIEMDVEDDESIESAYASVCKLLPDGMGLNLLINNAGVMDKKGSGGEFPGAKRATYQQHFNVNTTGAVMVTQVRVFC
jgi:NAD(P)-dependent dehydrogenase (short-subunit alcohol dehydrogenase family)